MGLAPQEYFHFSKAEYRKEKLVKDGGAKPTPALRWRSRVGVEST
ncbi:MAG: hypothetical protein UY04_C0036G0016 [Parcubacteria group bacterium GW2011_GWA2_47_7]|nr:MAG: hypothetical protein UY04_C0036G0016 [Parcubacteria group bacterium GW2011_GWA2_47_7]